MKFTDKYDFSLIENETKEHTIRQLEEELKDNHDACDCEACVLDMVCYALNRLKPTYSASLMGSVYANANIPLDEIRDAVKKAVEFVTENPAH